VSGPAAVVLFALFCSVAVVNGFIRGDSARLLRWPMYTRTAVLKLDLHDAHGREIHIHDYLLPGQIFASTSDLKKLVAYWSIELGAVSGRGTIFWAHGVHELSVRDGRVDLDLD